MCLIWVGIREGAKAQDGGDEEACELHTGIFYMMIKKFERPRREEIG